MLNSLTPLLNHKTGLAYRQDIILLCRALMKPGFSIPVGTDLKLADALLTREMDSVLIVNAAHSLLLANPQIVEILDSAWDRDEDTLDSLLSDGTLIAFLNSPLLQALLFTSPVPNLSMERLLTHVRRRLLESAVDPNWQCNATTLKAAAALSAQAFLTEYVFDESPHELRLADTLIARLDASSIEALDPFDVAVAGSYRALGTLGIADQFNNAPWYQSDASMQVLWRIQVQELERERELKKTIPQMKEIQDQTSKSVRSMYEENPYPRWVCYVRNESVLPSKVLSVACADADLPMFGDKQSIDILVAGCGTGRTAVEEAVLWQGSQVTAIDLSLASLAFGKRCAEDLGLESIEFSQADILDLPTLGRSFDYIACTGVLHHMADPIAGWKALVDVCRPGGVLRICLYSEAARRAVKSAAGFIKSKSSGSSADSIRKARQTFIDHAHQTGSVDHEWLEVFSRYDFYTTSMCRDLLFHVQEVEFTIPRIEAAIDHLGLRFCGFVDPEKFLTARYQAFAPDDPQGVDLKSWAKFETEYPDTFTSMYDFMVQKPLGP